MGADGASGRIGDEFAWELALEGAEEPLFHLPRAWMYRAPLPRTKLLSPAPAARFSGRLSVEGREIPVDGWRGMAGHNWGAQHAERWIWLHGLTQDGDWLDAAIGRVKIGPATTPWIGNGALSIAGDRYALRRAKVTEAPGHCTFVLSGSGVQVRGSVSAPPERFVGWVYADPDGSEHHTVNCSIADMRLSVSRGGGAASELVVPGGAAYELGMREHDHGIPIQPFAGRVRASRGDRDRPPAGGGVGVGVRPAPLARLAGGRDRRVRRRRPLHQPLRLRPALRHRVYEIAEHTPPRRQVVRSVAGPFPFESTLELSRTWAARACARRSSRARRTRWRASCSSSRRRSCGAASGGGSPASSRG